MLDYTTLSVFPTIDLTSWAIPTTKMMLLSDNIEGMKVMYDWELEFLIDPAA